MPSALKAVSHPAKLHAAVLIWGAIAEKTQKPMLMEKQMKNFM